MKIGDYTVGSGEPTFIIAEAGSNHNGNLTTARELIDAAADAGADAVKFQTFRADRMYVPESGTVEGPDGNRSLNKVIEEAQMPYDWIESLYEKCMDRNILFLSSPFDIESADNLWPYMPAVKIASSMLSHYPFLEYISDRQKPIIASTGAHDRTEINQAVDMLGGTGESVALLHCVSAYPTPIGDANLRAITSLKNLSEGPVGYSDHTVHPTRAPVAAVALGASIIEKHFTLDSSQSGLDHSFSVEPDELKRMVTAVRETEAALGTGEISVEEVERDWYQDARRTVQATHDIEPGQIITRDDVALLRSGDRTRGSHPNALTEIIGMEATEHIKEGEGVHTYCVTTPSEQSNKQ